MSISLLSGLWGMSVLMASTIYQIGVKRWANKKAEQVRQAGGPDEVKKNVEIGQQTSSKLALATRLAVGALAISYGLSIYGAVKDTTEKRVKALESQVADLKILVRERR